MTVVIFTGPSLSAADARQHLDAVYLPPVSQGDVYRVTLKSPRVIGIIDGLFERVPAVWHKEILYAMSKGIHVFGASSMGALRAAELSAFGMVGVGRIFEGFNTGEYEDDDEVAVVHASADDDFRVISDAMVNIRASLAAAVDAQIISRTAHDALVEIGKGLFYPERTYAAVLSQARAQGLAHDELVALSQWLPDGKRNQKRDDAVAMLEAVQVFLAGDPEPKTVDYEFEETEWWLRAQQAAGEIRLEVSSQQSHGDSVSFDELLDELRLEAATERGALRAAMLRHLLLVDANRRGISLEPELLEPVSDRLRRERGLLTLDSLKAWFRANELDEQTYGQLVLEEAVIQVMSGSLTEVAQAQIANELRISGDYARLRDRARDKKQVLQGLGLVNPGLVEADIDEMQLLRWHLGEGAELDWKAALQATGFEDLDAFRRALLREYCYRRASGSALGVTQTP
ncbi:TfuA-like protein [Enhygromyxa salina]|uniref:TfuA-like protein n=1 Tax=Enhygromyxa salina TaxID=215803 RepID=A0A2S9YTE9_9BACT|nr:TfuA-like protein [Enhygromyxa salina]PRQ08302.1 TfuA-like protein [Enhygromyxa salina]